MDLYAERQRTRPRRSPRGGVEPGCGLRHLDDGDVALLECAAVGLVENDLDRRVGAVVDREVADDVGRTGAGRGPALGRTRDVGTHDLEPELVLSDVESAIVRTLFLRWHACPDGQAIERLGPRRRLEHGDARRARAGDEGDRQAGYELAVVVLVENRRDRRLDRGRAEIERRA